MKILILILANDTPVYLQMQECWKKYMNVNENVKSYFIKYDVEELYDSDVTVCENTIYIKGKMDSLIPGCLDKTIKALEYSLNNMEFDYLIRTNMSSVWDINKIHTYLSNNTHSCLGVLTKYNNIKKFFISGAGIILSHSVCKNIIDNKHLLDYSIIDDVAIGIILKKLKYEFENFPRFNVMKLENGTYNLNKKHKARNYHFRCKTSLEHADTIELMNYTIKLIYKIK